MVALIRGISTRAPSRLVERREPLSLGPITAESAPVRSGTAGCRVVLIPVLAAGLMVFPSPAGAVPPGTFNVQVQALEVTQGVRGSIPSRIPPDGDFLIPGDGYELIANRRTVVRVYAWIEADAGTAPPVLTCELTGYEGANTLPGSPLAPVNAWVVPLTTWTLPGMRALAVRSWNFLLPASWVDLPLSESERILTFRAHVNPPGPLNVPECSGCDGDNVTFLGDQVFHHVIGHRIPQFVLRPIFVRPTYEVEGMGTVTADPVEFGFLSDMLREIDPIQPNSTQRSTRLVHPPVIVDFDGLRDGTFGRQKRRFLPGGSLSGIPPGDHYVSVWPTDGPGLNCAGGGARDGYAAIDGCALVFRHELGHSHGRRHPGGHEPRFTDPDYPGDHGEVGAEEHGYDLWSHVAYQPRQTPIPDVNPEGMTHDYLSGATSPKWSSLYTWEQIKTDIRSNVPDGGVPRPRTEGGYALVTGSIDGVGTVALDPLVGVPVPLRSIVNDGPWRIEFRDNVGNVLESYQLPEFDSVDGPETGLSFSEAVPVPDGWVSLAVVEGTTTLYEASRTPGVPLVFLTSPLPGAQWSSGENLMQWQAWDPEADPLWFRPEISPDGGQTWIAACDETADLEGTVDVRTVAEGGGLWRLRVQVSDGLNWSVSDEVEVSVPPKPPWAVISQPADGALILLSDCGLSLYGSGGDWEDGLLDGQSLVWFVDGQPVADGMSAEIPGLGPGGHEVILTAMDGLGLAGSDTASIQVIPDLAPPDLSAPQPGSIEPGPAVALWWTEVAGATMYDLEVARDAEMTDLAEAAEGLPYPWFATDNVAPGQTYYWRVRGRTICAPGAWSTIWDFTVDQPSAGPDGDRLRPPLLGFPNPMRTATTLAFRTEEAGETRVRVVDVLGREVAMVWSGRLGAGEHALVWDGNDGAGRPVASGVYRALVETGNAVMSRVIVVAR